TVVVYGLGQLHLRIVQESHAATVAPTAKPGKVRHRGWNTDAMPELPVVAVVGATAAGKSELALDLAEHLGGEVVNTDSMQLYRGMDIGTAKMPVSERGGIS